MRASARSGVQLTSLLDLLFIMIFIALLTSKIESAGAPLRGDGDLEEQTAASSKEKERIRGVANGQIRKLFVSNNYYKRGGESYIETNLYAADDNQLWISRINLVGAGLVTDTDDAPIAPEDPNRDGQRCEPLVATREKLIHDCRTVKADGQEIELHQISCDRVAARSYSCTERLFQKQGASVLRYNWDYRMDLVRIFDESLE
ncbi:MAG TPA: hypothetical protein VE175_03095 [Woeseiaceae bacterium]|jgi:hypothetical protein|nr:hypothetical protein [Woeseiaceae bacterium]